jgi:predicted nucleic acid-binding protein
MIPYVLDDLTLSEVARGDADLIRLLLSYDAAGQALVVPVLAAAAAYRQAPTTDAADSLRGLPDLDHATSAPVADVGQALRLIEIAAKTGLDVCAAHVAAVADASICPILTLDADRWRRASAALPDPLHIIEIADTDD